MRLSSLLRLYIAGGLTLYVAGGLAWFIPRPAPALTVVPLEDPAVALMAVELRRVLAPPEAHAAALLPFGGPIRRWSVLARIESAGDLGAEDYAIRPYPDEGRIVLTGGAPLGLAYGLGALAEDLRFKRAYLEYPLPLVRRPAVAFRMVSDPLEPSYPPLEKALAMGFNAVMTEPWPALALYQGYGPAERAWVEDRRAAARDRIAGAKALHLKVYALGDLVLLPRSAGTRHCVQDPRVQRMLAAGLDGVFNEFQQLDGIVVRTGENYPLGPLRGNVPSECGPDGVREAIAFMHREVVQRHGRELIVRAWDLGGNGFHARPERFREIDREGVTFSFKVTETDFWRYNAVNPNLVHPSGRGNLAPTVGAGFPGPAAARMVEFQAAREFEGKGAFPNYVAPVYADGLRSVNATHAWVWAKGGGWGGPHPTTHVWLDATVYAMARLLWDPGADPARLAEEWAALHFGPAAAPYLASLLMKSPEAVLKGLYVGCYGEGHPGWAPNLLWTRDDLIAGGERLEPMYRACGDISQAIAEKEQALALVEAMQQDLEWARPFIADEAAIRWMEASLRYQRSLFEVLGHYLTGMFRYYRGDSQRALEAFEALRGSWEAHQGPLSSQAATPYRDAGMWRTVEAARGALRRAG